MRPLFPPNLVKSTSINVYWEIFDDGIFTVASTELSDVRVTVAVSPSAFVIPNVIVTVGSAVDSTGTAAAAAAAAAVGAGKEKTISPDK